MAGKVDLRCTNCRLGRCENCTDVLRAFVGLPDQCPCTRVGHAGEPHGVDGHVCDPICEALNGA